MTVTNSASGTNVVEIAEGLYRIHTPVEMEGGPGAFSFNQYLLVDEEPLLFHTGLRRMFPLVQEAVAHVLPVKKLRWIGFSHVEADECGSLNEWLAAAPNATPLCGQLAAMVSVGDLADRAPRGLADGEVLSLGSKSVQWLDAPHLPHGWECGYLFEQSAGTLLCGDLFTQGGRGERAVVETDIVGPSEKMRAAMDYYAHAPHTVATLARFAALEPQLLACMHGSAWRGDARIPLRALSESLARTRPEVPAI
jgi:flavorubredoxin